MQYSYEHGPFHGPYLNAPYELLVKAFGNDGTVSPRDEHKSMAEWDVTTTFGEVEVYDYMVGTCYDPSGLERHEITRWHVQGKAEAVDQMLAWLDVAARST